ncbi:MAG: carbamoyltransferase C-terminal domain-containing protein [Polyangiaceae bacterium]
MSRLILGLNTDHGDSSAALVGDKGIIAAIADERITRKKHSADFPAAAIQEVLRLAGADISDVTDIAVARDPKANALAKAAFVVKHAESGVPMALNRLKVHRKVQSTAERIADHIGCRADSVRGAFHQVEHHYAHIASAFYWSPFERCTGFSLDGAGDFATTMWAECEGLDIKILRRSLWPHSLGVFYTAVCQYLGFDRYGEEYKVMGLSAYGKNTYGAAMRNLVSFHPQLGLRLNLDYYRHHTMRDAFEELEDGQVKLPRLWSDEMPRLLGPARKRNEELDERHRDISASMQIRYEEVFLEMVHALGQKTGSRDMVFAGGCALNSVANGRMITEGYADRAYYQPAASDDGTALGAALHVLHGIHRTPRLEAVNHAYWGTSWTDDEIEQALRDNGRPYEKLGIEALTQRCADQLAQGAILGWFQGREEWGPRALGNRSILCNPGWPDMKATLNARIKHRETFRPFAPAVLEEELNTCFEGSHPVPFMIMVYKVRPEWRERLSAATHEDGTGRVQTVRREDNQPYYDLISAFRERTGIPVLLNTSFNENEPIVHTPAQAISVFERTRMDCLGIGGFFMKKEAEG